MVGRKFRRQGRVALALCVVLGGCVGLGEPPFGGTDASRLKARAKTPVEPPGPELRIPADTVARGPDIPVVPLPPLGRQTAPPAPAAPPQPPQPQQRAPDASIPPATPSPPATPAPAGPPHDARQLLQQAAARCATLDSYIVRLTRREHLKGKNQPEEVIRFSFRRQPFSVHFKWLGDTAKGREVVYVRGRFDNKIHTKLAAGDAPLMPAGARLSIAPDSVLARSASRHPITDAGICHCVESLTTRLDAQERGDRSRGTLRVIAPQTRPEYPQPVEAIEHLLPPGVEPELPRGGRRLLFFDPEQHLPMVVVTYDDKGNEVEYYRYDRLIAPLPLDDDDFNPDKLWGAPARSKTTTATSR